MGTKDVHQILAITWLGSNTKETLGLSVTTMMSTLFMSRTFSSSLVEGIGILHIFCCMDHENYQKISRNLRMKRQLNPRQRWKKWKREFYYYFAPTYLKN